MRTLAVCIAVSGVVAMTACEGANSGGSDTASRSPAPTTVNCADAAELRQRSLEDHRQSLETKSDQAKIVTGNRATFYATLAIIADLKCNVTLPEADEALKPAFDAARKAEGTHSFYERAVWWSQAGYIATQVVPMLTKQLPAPISK